MYSIYCYENKINGKIYIGQTYLSLEERYNKTYKNCTLFNRALKKYGVENFNRWIFGICDTEEQVNQEEIFWIAEMRRILGKENVYNITDGGDLAPSRSPEVAAKIAKSLIGRPVSEETRKKMSNSHRNNGFVPWNKGKKNVYSEEVLEKWSYAHSNISEETRTKMSNSQKDREPWNKGKSPSEETIEKISKSKRGQRSSIATEFKKGQIPWNKGKSPSEETRSKISLSKKGIKKPEGAERKRAITLILKKKPHLKILV